MAAGTEPTIRASANPVVAKRHGLTKWDRARGQYVAPDPVEDVPVDYNTWTVKELKAELDKRRAAYEAAGNAEDAEYVGYQSSDKKELLVELLEADDEGPDEETEGD